MLNPADGEANWLRRIGSSGDDRVRSVAVAKDGTIAFGGDFVGRLALGKQRVISAGKPDGVVGALTAAGDPLWLTSIGGTRYASVGGVAFLSSGDVAATGHFAGQMSLLDRPIYSAGGADVFVARFHRAGGTLWAVRGGGPGADIGRALVPLDDGGVAIAGSAMNEADFGGKLVVVEGAGTDAFVASLDSDGRTRWAARSGGMESDAASSIVAVGDDLIAGGRSVPALIRGRGGALESATALPDIVEIAALAYSGRLFAARQVGNPIGVGAGVAISSGLLEGQTTTVNLASDVDVRASAMAAAGERLAVVGNFRGQLTVESERLRASPKGSGFVAIWRWPTR